MKRSLILLVCVWVYLLVYATPRDGDRVGIGDKVPAFSVKNQRGGTFCSTVWDKPAVIVFFHTKCYDCRKELPKLQDLYEYYGKQIQMICLSRAQSAEELSQYWHLNQLTLPYSAQEDKCIFKLFAERTIPRVYVVDTLGIVRHVFVEKVRKRKLKNAIYKELQRNNSKNK